MKSNKLVIVFLIIFLSLNLYGKNLSSIKVEYINFNKITLNNLFGFLSKEYNINFSLEPEYRNNTISIHLQNSDLKSLLDIITRDNGMVYTRKGGIIYITPFKQNLEKKFLEGDYKREKIVLNYASVSDTIQFLQDMMPGQALLRSTTENEPYSNLYDAKPKLTKPELKEEDDEDDEGTKIIPKIQTVEDETESSTSSSSNDDEIEQVKIDKDIPIDVVYIVPFFNTNSVYLLSTNARLIKEAKSLVKDIDQPLKQVLIQGEIIQLALGDEFSSVFNLDLASTLANATDTFGLTGSGGTKNISFNYFNEKIQASIDIAKTDNRASTVASPMLLAMNRVTSTLNLTYDIPMIVGYTAGELVQVDGGAVRKDPSPVYSSKEVGTVLKITPFINSRDEILLQVEITVSEVSSGGGKVTVTDSNGDLIDKDIDTVIESTVSTTLSTINGESIIIGGLIQKRKTSKNVKVPLLGDIPILGIPFNDVEEVDSKDEQVIVLTPILIDQRKPQSELVKRQLYRQIKSPKTLEQEIAEARAKDNTNMRDVTMSVPAIKEGIKKGVEKGFNRVKKAVKSDLKTTTSSETKRTNISKTPIEQKYDETIEEFLEE